MRSVYVSCSMSLCAVFFIWVCCISLVSFRVSMCLSVCDCVVYFLSEYIVLSLMCVVAVLVVWFWSL